MNASQRLALPFILPGQAQKELFHNEALQTLDLVVAAAVEEPPAQCSAGGTAAGGLLHHRRGAEWSMGRESEQPCGLH